MNSEMKQKRISMIVLGMIFMMLQIASSSSLDGSPSYAKPALFSKLLISSTAASPSASASGSSQPSALSAVRHLHSLSLSAYHSLALFSSSSISLSSSPALVSQMKEGAETKYIFHRTNRPVDRVLSDIVSLIPEAVTFNISKEAELKSLVADPKKFLFLIVHLPNDATQASQLVKKVQETLSALGPSLSVLETAPSLLQTDFPSLARTIRSVNDTADNSTTGNLFEVYNFFSAGVWMGIISTFVFLSILIFAVNLVSDLQTPTKFEKSA